MPSELGMAGQRRKPKEKWRANFVSSYTFVLFPPHQQAQANSSISHRLYLVSLAEAVVAPHPPQPGNSIFAVLRFSD